MAVSSSSSTSGSSIASIDVASVVDQLMKAENKPLDAITSKIDQQKLVISDLGTIKSKISVFQDALKDFENPNSYNTVDVSYLDKSVLTASGSNGALLGNFSVKVNSTASADTWTIKGFETSSDLIAIDSGGFNITVAGTSYNSKTPPSGVSALQDSPTIQDLAAWINSLGVDVAASVSQTTDSSHFVLQVFGKSTGSANSVTFSGITTTPISPTLTETQGNGTKTETGSVRFGALASGESVTVAGLTLTASSAISASAVASAFASLAAGATTGNSVLGGSWSGLLTGWRSGSVSSEDVTFTSTTENADVADLSVSVASRLAHSTTASDAEIIVNGTTFIRSSNTINDVVDGVTLNLFNSSATTQIVNVRRGNDNSEAVIKKMIEAYNDLISTYKDMTANSYNSAKPGTFANNPTTLAFINEIKARFSRGITYGSAMTKTLSLGAVGIDLQLDGTLKFNDITFIGAQSNGLQSKLAQGLSVGYTNSTNNLKTYISALVGITGGGGSLSDVVTTETEQINDLYKRQLTLQDKLAKVQENLVTQYSSLNALLYQLSSTSNALSNAFAALTNSNNK